MALMTYGLMSWFSEEQKGQWTMNISWLYACNLKSVFSTEGVGEGEKHRISNPSKGKPQYVDLFVRGMSKSLGTSLGHCRVCSFSRFSCGFSTQSFPAPKGTALEFNAVPYQKKNQNKKQL